jgi:hypothetical protein
VKSALKVSFNYLDTVEAQDLGGSVFMAIAHGLLTARNFLQGVVQ